MSELKVDQAGSDEGMKLFVRMDDDQVQRITAPSSFVSAYQNFLENPSKERFLSLMGELTKHPLDKYSEQALPVCATKIRPLWNSYDVWDTFKQKKCISDTTFEKNPLSFLFEYICERSTPPPQLEAFAESIRTVEDAVGALILMYMKWDPKFLTLHPEPYKFLCCGGDVKRRLVEDVTYLEYKFPNFPTFRADLLRAFREYYIDNLYFIDSMSHGYDDGTMISWIRNAQVVRLKLFTETFFGDMVRHAFSFKIPKKLLFWKLLKTRDIPLRYLDDMLISLDVKLPLIFWNEMHIIYKDDDPNFHSIVSLVYSSVRVPDIAALLRIWYGRCGKIVAKIYGQITRCVFEDRYPIFGKEEFVFELDSNKLLSILDYYRIISVNHPNSIEFIREKAIKGALQVAFDHCTTQTKYIYQKLFLQAMSEKSFAKYAPPLSEKDKPKKCVYEHEISNIYTHYYPDLNMGVDAYAK